MYGLFGRKKSQRRVALILFVLGMVVWVGWLWVQHLGAQDGVSIIPSLAPYHPLSLPSEESVVSEEALPRLSLAWEDFVRASGNSPYSGSTTMPRWQDGDYSALGLKKCPTLFAPQKCKSTWGNAYVQRWQMSKEIPKLCESNAASAIHCHDSPLLDPTSKQEGTKKKKPTRFCEFRNAMLNLRKMRISGGKRSFERGFLAASCGFSSPENIGINVYNPDIVSQSCDFVFNETVVVYSHSNIKRAWTVLKDYWGLFTMLQLAGTRTKEEIKQMTLLNVDSLVRGQASYFNGDRDDDTRAYFYTYHRMFRRVIKASDFPTKSSVCFGRLIWLSRSSDIHRDLLGAPLSQQQPAHPSTPFNESRQHPYGELFGSSSSVSSCHDFPREGSDFFHRWSAYIRSVHGIVGNKAPKASTAAPGAQKDSQMSIRINRARHSSNRVFQVLFDSTIRTSSSLLTALSAHRPTWVMQVADLSKASTRSLIELYSNTSMVVTERGSEALMGAAFMPLGTRYCCGIVEVEAGAGAGAAGEGAVQSFEAYASFMGHVHGEVFVQDAGAAEQFLKTVDKVERGMTARPSCVSS